MIEVQQVKMSAMQFKQAAAASVEVVGAWVTIAHCRSAQGGTGKDHSDADIRGGTKELRGCQGRGVCLGLWHDGR